MGATFISAVVVTRTPRSINKEMGGVRVDPLARKQLENIYGRMFKDAREYHGSDPYSGSWAACGAGLDVQPMRFRDDAKAATWLSDNHGKWDHPMAVKLTGKRWMIGAWAPE